MLVQSYNFIIYMNYIYDLISVKEPVSMRNQLWHNFEARCVVVMHRRRWKLTSGIFCGARDRRLGSYST